MKEERYLSLDWIRGLAIILVVAGHALHTNTAGGINENFLLRSIAYEWIYSFHMPLMFAISGVTFAKYIFDEISLDDKKNCIKNKFMRLMVPYFSFGFICAPFKILFSSFTIKVVDWSDIWKIFGGENPVGQLWFLYALFVIMVISLLFINKKNFLKWFLFTFALSFLGAINLSGIGIINKILRNFVYFLFGCAIGNNYERIKSKLCDFNKAMVIFVLAIFDISIFATMFNWNIKFLWPLTAFIGTVGCFAVAFYLESKQLISSTGTISQIGKNTMGIYLFHSPIQVAVRTITWRFLKWPYLVTLALKFVVGFYGSILIQKLFVEKSRILSFLFLGEFKKKF